MQRERRERHISRSPLGLLIDEDTFLWLMAEWQRRAPKRVTVKRLSEERTDA